MKMVFDHCQCAMNVSWDSVNNTLVYTNSDFVCPAHTSLTGSNILSASWEENRRKNDTLGLVLTNLMAQIGTTDPVSGAPILKNGVTYNISWTGTAPNRVLNVSFSGITLTAAQKSTLQNVANTKFGTGKVVVN